MQSQAKLKQHRIDVACGYALGAYAGVSLCWIAVLFTPVMTFFFLLVAACAGLFGLLRSLTLPMRFKLMPAAALCFVVLLAGIISTGFAKHIAVTAVVILGFAYSAALFIPMLRLWTREFAKPLPPWICHRCDYPLYGLSEPTCPECGKPFDPSRVPDAPKPTISAPGD